MIPAIPATPDDPVDCFERLESHGIMAARFTTVSYGECKVHQADAAQFFKITVRRRDPVIRKRYKSAGRICRR